MRKQILLIALILSFLYVFPFEWYLNGPNFLTEIIKMLTSGTLYFIGFLLVIQTIQYLKMKQEKENKIIQLLQELSKKN
ncbi:hypothetical protein [Bacillus mobilis]|uniref:hypothetical protein n=1 Tax=Bacillus mobilis TaxID=2026190 RepID=UPI002E1B6B3D|nr:hypothetical protein [Bacillus mobilis]MED0930248.1 hypothetical protein [Bacillus mobilis]MED0952930.1 hypothetical protein [Bacillus mobilis]